MPPLSAVGHLAALGTRSGRGSALSELICLRSSELLFVLQCVTLGSGLQTANRELSDAIHNLKSSDLCSRITATAYTHAQQSQFRASNVSSSLSSLDRESAIILCMDRNAALQARVSAIRLGELAGTSRWPVTEEQEDLDLLSPLMSEEGEGATDEVMTVQAAADLAVLHWLISAARAALKAVYEQQELGRNIGTLRELQELRDNLLSRQGTVQACLADYKRLCLCSELGSILRAELRMMLEQQCGGKQTSRGDMPASSLQSLLLTAGSIADGSGGRGDSHEQTVNDDASLAALCKLSASRLKVEKQISRAAISAVLSSAIQNDASVDSRSPLRHTNSSSNIKPTSKLAALAVHSKGGPRSLSGVKSGNLPIQTASTRADATCSLHAGRRHSALQAGGPNPLWVIMQNVFSQQ